MKAVQWIAAMAMTVAATVGTAQAAPVVVGQVGPMSGLDAAQARAYAVGMQLAFQEANKSGGMNGSTLTLVRKDDGGRPADTLAATRELLAQDKPLVLAGYFGSRNIADLVNSGLLQSEHIPLVGYRVAEIRPETPLLYNVRATVTDEINKLTQHLSTIGITRIALLYEDGPGAAALLAAVDQAAQQAKVTVIAKSAYASGTAHVESAVNSFVAAKPQAIIMAASGAAAAAFIEGYRAQDGAAQLFATSSVDLEQLSKRLADEQMQGVAIAQVTPDPYQISSRLTKDFLDVVAKSGKLEVPVSYAMMEGFIAGKVIAEAVRRQHGKPTREGTIAALDTMDVNLGGYAVSFRPGMHSGSHFVELSIINGRGRIVQ